MESRKTHELNKCRLLGGDMDEPFPGGSSLKVEEELFVFQI